MSNFNAKIGVENEFKPVTGGYSLHNVTSENGIRLIDFGIEHDLVIGSTMFPHKNIHKMIWWSPDNTTFNQIDHALIDVRNFSNLMDVRTYRSANIDSDHYLGLAKVRARIFNFKNTPRKGQVKFNLSKLKIKESSDSFERNKIWSLIILKM